MRRRILNPRYDLAIAGAGFAGSIMAMIAARLGLAVVLIERGRHPRVVIGESSTPLSNLLLEQLADTYDLPCRSGAPGSSIILTLRADSNAASPSSTTTTAASK